MTRRPKGCVCEIETWIQPMRPICGRYEENMEGQVPGECLCCYHDKACHKKKGKK